ncbi:hypothetical protein Drorol1_Dr00004934 [Drosera rotundifolia]
MATAFPATISPNPTLSSPLNQHHHHHHNTLPISSPTRILNHKTPQFPSTLITKALATSQSSKDDYHATLKALNSKNRFPRKSLGQHYMLNVEVYKQLVDVAGVREGDVVLEIGPGTGCLTNVLIEAGATVLAIEKDPHMVSLVKERFSSTERLKVLEEDFTKCCVRSHLNSLLESKNMSGVQSRCKVVANIPFNISQDVVRQLLPMGDIFSEVVLFLQDETALRLAEPSLRSPEYRLINIFVNYYADAEYKFHVPRRHFFPQPKVDAAAISFKLKQPADYPVVSSIKSFFLMINTAFNGKRKMLRKTLGYLCASAKIEAALLSLGLPVTSRPEELTLDDFVKLHNSIAKL